MLSESDAARFWSRVEKHGASDCWPWTGGKTPVGYGAFWLATRNYGAHRISWTIANRREIPDGLVVCHKCDNPICVNPAHLFLGTNGDNLRDAIAKGRHTGTTYRRVRPDELPRGSGHWSALFTEDTVMHVRALFEGGMRQRDIMKLTGITRQHVSRLCRQHKDGRYKNWAHAIP